MWQTRVQNEGGSTSQTLLFMAECLESSQHSSSSESHQHSSESYPPVEPPTQATSTSAEPSPDDG
ncbi:hypothetical protein U1Q18_022933 [Sarracenia purpurea var. burkii]